MATAVSQHLLKLWPVGCSGGLPAINEQSLNSTLRTALARLCIGQRYSCPTAQHPVLPDPIAGVLSVMAIFHHYSCPRTPKSPSFSLTCLFSKRRIRRCRGVLT